MPTSQWPASPASPANPAVPADKQLRHPAEGERCSREDARTLDPTLVPDLWLRLGGGWKLVTCFAPSKLGLDSCTLLGKWPRFIDIFTVTVGIRRRVHARARTRAPRAVDTAAAAICSEPQVSPSRPYQCCSSRTSTSYATCTMSRSAGGGATPCRTCGCALFARFSSLPCLSLPPPYTCPGASPPSPHAYAFRPSHGFSPLLQVPLETTGEAARGDARRSRQRHGASRSDRPVCGRPHSHRG